MVGPNITSVENDRVSDFKVVLDKKSKKLKTQIESYFQQEDNSSKRSNNPFDECNLSEIPKVPLNTSLFCPQTTSRCFLPHSSAENSIISGIDREREEQFASSFLGRLGLTRQCSLEDVRSRIQEINEQVDDQLSQTLSILEQSRNTDTCNNSEGQLESELQGEGVEQGEGIEQDLEETGVFEQVQEEDQIQQVGDNEQGAEDEQGEGNQQGEGFDKNFEDDFHSVTSEFEGFSDQGEDLEQGERLDLQLLEAGLFSDSNSENSDLDNTVVATDEQPVQEEGSAEIPPAQEQLRRSTRVRKPVNRYSLQ